MLNRDDARKMLKIFHPSLGTPLVERDYASDCRVFTPENKISKFYNIYDAVFDKNGYLDIHVIAHFVGYWFKMMIMRDTKIAWIISGTFEIIEISFSHWLKNFQECWWDRLILDLFGCNMIGIYLGSLTLKYMGVSKFEWVCQK